MWFHGVSFQHSTFSCIQRELYFQQDIVNVNIIWIINIIISLTNINVCCLI